ncbi:AtpZ/AtpI family protein [Cereibacter azotoformans]|uniref:ATP synthase protein I n=2 Tax=Cereibacter TaxID=1653176 RepID=A0A2T5KEC6_9RHOB|nr:AtpZ/AtpI family protein [Cereibacter azotoformans]AXQ92466.1 F0F1 ATP synthase subunit I [Cereibacter sphaeroides]MBO4169960.1 AtpZ/AtpI family protein [Cereibacter azotoformans]PTR20778.1 ATP synthase protein I [Cereibacter azotoformans]UIJ30742.1 AtpZ/AtpI family protein [Cereibacter azotoformans]ULB08499.1 AtpZ/AtpI family protein [Cereibacter azotoformans]
MAEEPDPDRLRALEERIAKANSGRKSGRSTAGKGFSQGEVAWRMVIELVSGMVLGLAIGYGLDWTFGTMPIFLMIFALLGFVAGVKTMLRTARQLQVSDRDRTADTSARGD